MQIRDKDVLIKPILAADFPDLRDLYNEYITGAIHLKKPELVKVGQKLLAFALKRTDPVLAKDPKLFSELDGDEVKQIVSDACGDLKNSLQVATNLIEQNVSRFINAQITKVGVENLDVPGLNTSPASPLHLVPPLETSKT